MAKRKKQKKNSLVAIVLILIMLISIGYAFLSTTLNINGTANISAAQWSVYFDNVQVKDGSVEATATPTVPENSKTTTTLTYEVNMSTPGEYYEFTTDIVNDGTIDAMLDKLEVSTLNETQAKYLDYVVTYADGGVISEKDLLKSKETETIKVGLYFKTEINAADLPSEDDEISATVKMEYVQADDNAKARKNSIELSVANYGNKINYSVDVNGVTLDTWSLFYEKDGNAYMIYDGVLPTDAIDTTKTSLEVNQYGGAGWPNYRTTLLQPYNKSAAADLNNTEAWSQLLSENLKSKDSTAVAKGGVDVETWVASWNAKGELEGYEKYPMLYTKEESKGYNISEKEDAWYHQINWGNIEGLSNSLYFIGEIYWTASPSSAAEDRLILVGGDSKGWGGIGPCDDSIWSCMKIRPIITFNSNLLTAGSVEGTLDIK